ncbi:MAG: hypothetical protein M0Q41_07530 [Bacteroidales bacterium]|nr:hypothetical protein [Bacteroidales bacterium]
MKNRFLNIVSILLMGHFYLLIVFNNLPNILNSSLFFIPLWFISLGIIHPKMLFSKENLQIYSYIIFFVVSFNFFWQDVVVGEQRKIYIEIGAILTAHTILYYYIVRNDFKGLSLLIKVTFFFILISSITSLIGFVRYPLAARELAGVLAREGNFTTIIRYQSLGIGGYGFFASLIFVPPLLITYILSTKPIYKQKLFILISIIIIYLSLITAQYFANFLICTFAVVISVFKIKNFKTIFILSVLIMPLLLFDISLIFSQALYSLSALFSKYSELSHKLSDLGAYFLNSNISGYEVEARSMRFPILLENFLTNPLRGSSEGNQHLHWMNKLSMFGLLGTLPFFLIVRKLFKTTFFSLHPLLKYYYVVSFLSYFFLGLLKAAHLREILIMVFLIVPGFLVSQSHFIHKQKIDKSL